MATSEERMQILRMLSEGKVSAEDAAQLLQALEASSRPKSADHPEPKWLKVRVTDLTTGQHKVNVTIPIGLVNVGVKMGAKFAPEIEGLNIDDVISEVKTGAYGCIADITDETSGERVEVYVE